ncbi:MAG: methyltransferase domain-containing protein [Candidatus Bathyarchaeota archaeon]|nr:methyltransferase domain-containing protein [Candidatus Bathyarchaeota archaeon]
MDYEKLAEQRKLETMKPLAVRDLVVLDAGTGEGAMTTLLAEQIGNGVIISVDMDPSCLEVTREKLCKENLLDKVSLHKADLRSLDFVETRSIDLVVAYGTLGPIEDYTPGGTISVLKEFFRVLKSGAFLSITGELKIEDEEDDAQVTYKRFERLERAIAELIGDSHEVNWSPEWVKDRLEEIGFEDIYWKKIDDGIALESRYLKSWSSHLRRCIDRIASRDLQTAFLRELDDIEKAARISSFKANPAYAIYARKP